MKINKINDNQIKCILTEQDLEDRHLNLREMSYNSAEIRKLFAEVIRLAYNNLGFDANNVPLKIDVIPLRTSAVLFITKVEEPEELNPSYSHFSPSVYEKMKNPPNEEQSDLSESFKNLINALFPEGGEALPAQSIEEMPAANAIIYSFSKAEGVIDACKAISATYDHCSSLYFDKSKNLYYLKLYMDGTPDPNFRQNCITLLEYGKTIKSDSYFESYLSENTELIAEGNVVERMGGKKD
ncbi:MAG: adaptor protein MecA [Lachnospiraceae bacterium]|nr:adaptor protein MecA [Lachnospiraceae bacterium]